MGARGVIALVSVLVVLGLALFMFDLPRAVDDDMAPSIRKGDLLLACRVCGAPKRGDIVLFTPPGGNGMIIRRVIGAPGDNVYTRFGAVTVDGQMLATERAGEMKLGDTNYSVTLETNGSHQYRTLYDDKLPLPPDRAVELHDEYFLAADRRSGTPNHSYYVPVPHADVRSTVLRILRTGDGDATRPKRLP